MGRRRWLFGFLTLVLLWTSAAAAQPARDVVVVGMEAEPPGLDPGQALGLHTLRVTYQIFETLVTTPDDSTDVVPGLAESWQTSPDGLAWTFKLRPRRPLPRRHPARRPGRQVHLRPRHRPRPSARQERQVVVCLRLPVQREVRRRRGPAHRAAQSEVPDGVAAGPARAAELRDRQPDRVCQGARRLQPDAGRQRTVPRRVVGPGQPPRAPPQRRLLGHQGQARAPGVPTDPGGQRSGDRAAHGRRRPDLADPARLRGASGEDGRDHRPQEDGAHRLVRRAST